MGDKLIDEDLAGLTPAARKEYGKFKRRQKGRIEEIKQIVLTILVWGPSLKSETPLAKRRRQLWEILREQGHLALYSETLCKEVKGEGEHTYFSLEFLEFNQAREAHLVVLLVEKEAIGAVGEMHSFGTNTALVSKMYILVPEEFQGSYSSGSVIWIVDNGYGGVQWYKESEIEASEFLDKILNRVQARREMRYKEAIQRKLARRGSG